MPQDAEQRASDAEEEQMRAEQEAAALAAELRSLQTASAVQHAGDAGEGRGSDSHDGRSADTNDAQVLAPSVPCAIASLLAG